MSFIGILVKMLLLKITLLVLIAFNAIKKTHHNQKVTFIKGLIEKSFIRLEAGYSDNPVSFDPFVIYYDAGASFNFDGQYDAFKLHNTDQAVTNFYVFADDETKLSISGIPSLCEGSCSFRLGLKTERDGEVLVRLRDIQGIYCNRRITLIDSTLLTSQYLSASDEYRVPLSAGDYQSRFYLCITDFPTEIETEQYEINDARVYYKNGRIVFELLSPEKGIITVYNYTGRICHIQKVNRGVTYILSDMNEAGLYFITFISDAGRLTHKIMVPF